MWYVMQVVSGKERNTVLMMERTLSDGILEKCFVPMRRMKKKYRGKWQEITEKLFPGYVFLVSDRPQLLYDELKDIPALTKLLGNCEEYFTPLSDKDVHILQKLQDMQEAGKNMERRPKDSKKKAGRQDSPVFGGSVYGYPETGLSEVMVGEDGQIRIVSGPLKDLAGQIRKMNLHKRIAVVETEFMGNRTLIHLGIEIVGKEE